MSDLVIDRVIKELQALPESMQRQVLQFAVMLRATTQKGVPGRHLLAFAGSIPPNKLDEMAEAIEAGCERIDDGDW